MTRILPAQKLQRYGKRSAQRGGFAMLVVLVILIAMLGMAAVHQRQLSAAMRVEQAVIAAEARSRGPIRVLAQAVEVAEAGPPPVSPAVYGVIVAVDGVSQHYSVTYTQVGTDWDVDVLRVKDAAGLTALPDHF